MDHTHLGRTGLKVSRLALRTMNFGELTDEAVSFAIMDEALDVGRKTGQLVCYLTRQLVCSLHYSYPSLSEHRLRV